MFLAKFKPLSIDDRINQRLRTRAFWRYLAPASMAGAKVLRPVDYTTFTEVDEVDDKISRTSTRVTFTTLHRTHDHYVYKDYGAGYFSDFEHQFDYYISAHNDGLNVFNDVWMLANAVDDEKGLRDADETHVGLMIYTFNDIRAFEWYAGTLYEVSRAGAVPYRTYVTITKTGTKLKFEFFYDAARTNKMVTDINLTLHGNWSFRYLYAVCNYNDGFVYYQSGDSSNLAIT